jgi:hypothetical protein
MFSVKEQDIIMLVEFILKILSTSDKAISSRDSLRGDACMDYLIVYYLI